MTTTVTHLDGRTRHLRAVSGQHAATGGSPVSYQVVADGQVVSEHGDGWAAKQAALKTRGRAVGVCRSDGAPAFTDAAPARPPLSRAGALRLDQAEMFLLSLDSEMLTADNLRAAYLLGIAELHLANLIELVRAVAS